MSLFPRSYLAALFPTGEKIVRVLEGGNSAAGYFRAFFI
jgi:hypothetical protein